MNLLLDCDIGLIIFYRMKHKKIIILFSGYSINNTPKIGRLISCYNESGISVELMGIVKYYNNEVNPNLYAINDVKGFAKVFLTLFYQFKLFSKLFLAKDYDYIYSINPVSTILALCLHYIKGVNYVYESHEMIFGVNYPFFTGPYRRFWIFVDKLLIKNSFLFLTTDKFRLKFYKRLYKINDDIATDYLLNVPFPNENNFYEIERFNNRFVISYCGGIAPGRSIEEIILAFSAYFQNFDCAFLLLAGSVSVEYKNKLIALLDSFGVSSSNYEFTGSITNTELTNYMYNSSITFALYDKSSLNNRYCSPNKVFDAIHTGTPLICSDSWLTAEVCKDYLVGSVIKQNDANLILKSLNDIRSICFNDFGKAQVRFDFKFEFKRLKIKLLNGVN